MKFETIREEGNSLYIEGENSSLRLEAVGENIIRCSLADMNFHRPSDLVLEQKPLPLTYSDRDGSYELETEVLALGIDRESGRFTWQDKASGTVLLREGDKTLTPVDVIRYSTQGEEPILERVKTVDGERSFIKNLKPQVDRTAYRAKINFDFQDDEGIYGLGQAEEGIFNYRHTNQYLYQHNMRIPIPFFISSKGYGILVDCGSLMTFNDDRRGSYLFCDTVDQLDYYFIAGKDFDEIIAGYRELTGRAVMLSRWTYGYVQSKEAYRTGDELVDVARKYRELSIPLDCIVQDWNTWEPGKWGQKTVDKSRYPDLRKTNDELHGMNVHSMVSVWPNMNPGCENHGEFAEAGLLLNDNSTYDAFSEKGRAIYFRQAEEELFKGGFDSWWCDSTEPFPGPDWQGSEMKEPWERYHLVGEEHKQFLDPGQANLYALMHARGIYENQRAGYPDKRVVNLTRSGYASSQRFGTVLWSGDIAATWDVMKKQIAEGLNFALSGMPYWTLDIGAFFTVGKAWQKRGCGQNENPNPLWFWKGDYDEGVEDPAYRELYVRWLQFGTFLSMFRSHGTDTPREIWNFGEPGDMFYDTIASFIRLRYRLIPYIYSLASLVNRKHYTMVRSLLFDYREDEEALSLADEFMFGPAFLVCPVTEPMYYDKKGKMEGTEKIRKCYLPGKDTVWHDFWTGVEFGGSQWITADAPLEKMPLFVRAGSILPMAEGLQYADQADGADLDIHVYPGADGFFELYEDEGDNYAYEEGAFSLIPLTWNEGEKILTLGDRQGAYPGMREKRNVRVHLKGITKSLIYEGRAVSLSF